MSPGSVTLIGTWPLSNMVTVKGTKAKINKHCKCGVYSRHLTCHQIDDSKHYFNTLYN